MINFEDPLNISFCCRLILKGKPQRKINRNKNLELKDSITIKVFRFKGTSSKRSYLFFHFVHAGIWKRQKNHTHQKIAQKSDSFHLFVLISFYLNMRASELIDTYIHTQSKWKDIIYFDHCAPSSSSSSNKTPFTNDLMASVFVMLKFKAKHEPT